MLARVLAALALVLGLVVLPVAVWALVGGPGAIDWSGVLGSGRIDADTVVALGLVVFTLLWAWFAATAVVEVGRVLAWRHEPTAVLPPTDPTPSGAIRRLVRTALVSTSTVLGASLASLTGVQGVGAAAPAPHMSVEVTHAPERELATVGATSAGVAPRSGATPTIGRAGSVDVAGPTVLHSTGRETPYSVAVRLGDTSLRDRIIELNHGLPTPDGGVWTGGVFPAGMDVVVPAGLLGTDEVTWQAYTVVDGDSVYRIATRLADGDHLRVRDLADRIIERNLGRTMHDGKVFDDPSLIRVGWVIDVPVAAAPSSPAAAPRAVPDVSETGAHLVTPGESYWSIAADHVDPPGDASVVAELTDELIDHNAPRLGYALRQMLHPGDVVEFPDAGPTPVPAAADAVDAVDGVGAVGAVDGRGLADVVIGAPVRPAHDPETDAVDVTDATDTDVTDTDTDVTDDVDDVDEDAADVESVDPAVDGSGAASGGGATRPVGAPRPGAPGEAAASVRAPVTTSLAAAVLLCAGLLGLAESRRRRQLRRAGTHARLPVTSVRAQRIERLVRSLDATQRAVRLDLVLRAAGHVLVGTGGYVLAAIVADDGAVDLVLDRPGRQPVAPWVAGPAPDRWALPADIDDVELAPSARLAGQPCPAVVHLGRVAADDGLPSAGELFVDLEAFGLVCLDADERDAAGADAVLRAIAASLAASPVGETLRLITHEVEAAVHLGNLNAEAADDIDTALDLAASALGSTPTAIGHRRTAELRARGVGGEAWEPVVVVSGSDHLPDSARRELLEVTRGGGRGLAVVLRHPVEGASLTMRATQAGWVIERLGLTVVPVGIELQQVHDARHLLYAAEQPLLDAPFVASVTRATSAFSEPAWDLMVRVLGGVDIVAPDGTPVPFDRGKSLELVTWLALHRDQSTRGGARSALWEMDVRDATFANVVSDARRSLARVVSPPEGEEWVARTLTDQLPLHDRVRSDADLLRARLEQSRGRSPQDAVEILRPGVALIRDHPFAGTDYLWPDAEGTTSALTLLATGASTELARHHLALGDVDGVFWATGQGLKVLPGHEELIGLRMRAHAQRGDLAGVRQEWDAYERAITADAWSDGEPSPKLLALRKELLQH